MPLENDFHKTQAKEDEVDTLNELDEQDTLDKPYELDTLDELEKL